MLDSDFVFLVLAPFSYFLLLLYFRNRKHGTPIKFMISLFLLYLLALVSITLFPLPIDSNLVADRGLMNNLQNNYIPFATIVDAWQYGYFPLFLKQIGGNILLTVPFGFLLPLIWRKNDSFRHMFLCGLLFTIGVESVQFLISALYGYTYKITDVDDVLLNTLGCMIGYLCFRAAKPLLEAVVPDLRRQQLRRRVVA
jgi:glycopeptide antibiotics resistance protein